MERKEIKVKEPEYKDSANNKCGVDNKHNIPKDVVEEIVRHCETCTFQADYAGFKVKNVKDEKNEKLSSKSCVLKIWLANNFSINLPAAYIDGVPNPNILHFLIFQHVSTEKQILHQKLVNKLLPMTNINFNTIKWQNEESRINLNIIYSLVLGRLNEKLELILEYNVDVNAIIHGDGNVVLRNDRQYTLLDVCQHPLNGTINFTAARMLLSAGAKTEIEYTRDKIKTNIYRHYLNLLQLNSQPIVDREDLRKFVKLLKGITWARNVTTRMICRYRRRKLANAMIESAILSRIHFAVNIIISYIVFAPVVRL